MNTHDTVVISDLNARGRARVLFQPRIGPYIGGARLSPNEAYVVRGTVYYIDGNGNVSTIGLDGKPAVVTRFPVNITAPPDSASFADGEVSFAVSPNGCQLAATISNGSQLQTMRAVAGGTAEVLHTWTSNSSGGFKNLVLVGWDSIGPIVVVGSDIGMTGYTPVDFIANRDFLGGVVAHLGGDGTVGPLVGPSTCKPAQVTPRGDVTCYQRGTLTVIRSTGGTELGPIDVSVPEGIAYVATGPDGLIAFAGSGIGVPQPLVGQWRGPNGASGTLPAAFFPEGWLDSKTIFGRIGNSMSPRNAALVRISGSQAALEDLGFEGDFVGLLGG